MFGMPGWDFVLVGIIQSPPLSGLACVFVVGVVLVVVCGLSGLLCDLLRELDLLVVSWMDISWVWCLRWMIWV